MTARKDIALAGVCVSLRSQQADGLDGLSEYYERYAAPSDRHDLIVEIERDPTHVAPPARAPYPGFDCRATGPGRIEVHRAGATGVIELPDQPGAPATARFRLDDSVALEAAVRIALSIVLPRLSGAILHASSVRIDGRALVFAGVSGAGKSTIARLLTEGATDRTRLADELLVVRASAGQWRVYVAPFHGIQGLPLGEDWPLAGVYFLSHAGEHRVRTLGRGEATAQLLRHTLAYVADRATATAALDVVAHLAADVPCHSLAFANDPSVARVLGVT